MSLKKILPWVVLTPMLGMAGCDGTNSFSSEILPILQDACTDCHSISGEGIQASGLALDTYEGVMKGTKFGPVVSPGQAISSTLYLVISHNVAVDIQMPPHHHEKVAMGAGEPLTPEEIDTIKNWIDQGAKNN